MVGYNCLIEPQSILRSARVGDGCIVGARSVLCEGSMMEDGSILAPGSVLPPGRRVPKGELWAGSPARFVRKLSGHEQEEVPRLAELMSVLAYDFFREVLPNGTQWRKVRRLVFHRILMILSLYSTPAAAAAPLLPPAACSAAACSHLTLQNSPRRLLAGAPVRHGPAASRGARTLAGGCLIPPHVIRTHVLACARPAPVPAAAQIEAWRKHVTDSGEATWVDFRAAKYQMRLEHEAQLMEKMTS